jgi:WD40 repeat protein
MSNFEEQVKRNLVGNAFVEVAYLACVLALQEEVQSVATLAALLKRWNIVQGSEPEASNKISKALTQLGFMSALSSTLNGESGYRVYPLSFRDHLLRTQELADICAHTREQLADAAKDPGNDAAARYLYRSGIRHLINAGRVGEAADLLSDFNYLMDRFICLASEGQKAVVDVAADWRRIEIGSRREGEAQLTEEQREGRNFFRKRVHLLRNATDRWPAHRVLLQLALEYRAGSKISRDAEAFARADSSEPLLMHGPVGFIEAADSSVAVLSGHTAEINGALVLADGRFLSWSNDETLRLWEADGTPIEPALIGHTRKVNGALALQDGRLLSWSDDRTLRLWEPDGTPVEPALVGHTRMVNGALALPDGRLLSWSMDETLRLWKADGTPIEPPLRGHGGDVEGALVLRDGRLLSWSPKGQHGEGTLGTLRLWEADGAPLEEYTHLRIDSVSELPDGRLLSWCRPDDMRFREADGTPIEPLLIGHTGHVNGALALPDGRLLSWSNDCTLRLWESDGSPIEPPLKGHSEPIYHAQVLPDGKILSQSYDEGFRLWQSDGTPIDGTFGEAGESPALVLPVGKILTWSEYGDFALRLRQMDGRPIKLLLGHGGRVLGALPLPEGRLLSWSADKTLRIWELEGGALAPELTRHERQVNGLLTLPDGRVLSWSADKTLRLWNADGTPIEPPLKGHTKYVMGALVLQNGRLLSWSGDGALRLWEANGTAVGPPWVGHQGVVGAIVLRDGRLLSWSEDCTLRLWKPDGTPIEPPLTGQVIDVAGAFELADGRLLSWSSYRTWHLWEANGAPIEPPHEIPHRSLINGMLVLADGRLLSWSEDGTLRFSRLDGTSIGPPLIGHKGMVDGALELPNDRLVSWCGTKFYYTRFINADEPPPVNETALRLWQLDGTPIAVSLLEHTDEVNGVMVLPDRRRLLSWSDDGRLCLWSIDRNNEVLLSVYSFGTPITACTLRDEKSVFAGLASGHVAIVSIDASAVTKSGLRAAGKAFPSLREAASSWSRGRKT